MKPNIQSQIDVELLKATKKYPHFADRFISPYTTNRDIKTELDVARHKSDAECDRHYWSVEATLREEVAEVMEAASTLQWDNCKQELAQVAAVCVRAIEWINNQQTTEESK